MSGTIIIAKVIIEGSNYITAVYLGHRVAKVVKKLPKWAIKQAGGINKKAWSLARRGRKSSSSPRRPAVQSGRRNPKPKGGNNVARRTKNLNINLIDLGGGIVLLDQFLGPQALNDILAFKMPNLSGLPARLREPSTQGALIKTGVGIAVLKTALKGFTRQVGAIGPLKLKV